MFLYPLPILFARQFIYLFQPFINSPAPPNKENQSPDKDKPYQKSYSKVFSY